MVIVKDLRPINIVNGEGFQQLIGFLEPEYRLPSATHLTHLIENRYKAEKQKVCDVINSEADYIAITADMWTSMATESYLTMTVHYLNSQWLMKSLIPGTMPLSESHTAANLVVWIKEMVDDCGTSKEKIVAFLHNNCKIILASPWKMNMVGSPLDVLVIFYNFM